jgi:hypothetical protein
MDLATGRTTTLLADDPVIVGRSHSSSGWAVSADNKTVAFVATRVIGVDGPPLGAQSTLYRKFEGRPVEWVSGESARSPVPCEAALKNDDYSERVSWPALSGDGKTIAFDTNVALDSGDTNCWFDTYIRK